MVHPPKKPIQADVNLKRAAESPLASPCASKHIDSRKTPVKLTLTEFLSHGSVDPDRAKGFREKAADYIMSSKYVACFQLLITNSDSARAAFESVVYSDIKKEVSRISRRTWRPELAVQHVSTG